MSPTATVQVVIYDAPAAQAGSCGGGGRSFRGAGTSAGEFLLV